MQLHTYIKSLNEDSGAPYTPSALDVPGSICKKFTSSLEKSDRNCLEYGNNLFFKKESGKLSIGSIEYQGRTGDAVDLHTGEVAAGDDSYLGDFHTHPYRLKYGPNISIGPSNTDWDTWHRCRPKGFSFAIHFVASGSDLFCVIFRKKDRSVDLKAEGAIDDAGRINEMMLNAGEDVLDAYSTAHDEFKRNKKSMTGFFEKYKLEIPETHERDAHQMSIDLSNRNTCEYYRGRLDNQRSILRLYSNRVFGNWLAVNMWYSKNEPWVNWRFW